MTLAHPTLQQMSGELHVGEEFLAKYNRPGPRYTSYPTAPVWNDAFGPATVPGHPFRCTCTFPFVKASASFARATSLSKRTRASHHLILTS